MAKKRTKPEIVFVTQTHIRSFDESEIDFDLDKDFDVDKDSDVNYQYLHVIEKECERAVGNMPIDIDRVIGILKTLRDEGCNYVALDYHTDHIAYEISGFKIEASTPEEVAEYQAEKTRVETAEARIAELIEEARQISSENGLTRF